MEAVIYRSDDPEVLERLVKNFVPGKPFWDDNGVRIGSIVGLRQDGDRLIADIECPHSEVHRLARTLIPYERLA